MLEMYKKYKGISGNGAFDDILLISLGLACANITMLGVPGFDMGIAADTEWPVIVDVTLYQLCMSYINISVDNSFDPPANAILSQSRKTIMDSLASMIQIKISEMESEDE